MDKLSFSHIVDDILARSHRAPLPGNINDITSYVNATVLQVVNTGLYKRDLVEEEITVAGSSGHYVWPRPMNFRQTLAVRYNIVDVNQGFVYPLRREPGKDIDAGGIYYYYYSGDSIVFNGVSDGVKISVAYYTRPRRLPYFAADARPAAFNLETETWDYDAARIAAGATEAALRNLSVNWAILYWPDLVAEGASSKFLNKLGDERAKAAYATFKELIKDVPRTETLGHTEFLQLPVNTGGVSSREEQ